MHQRLILLIAEGTSCCFTKMLDLLLGPQTEGQSPSEGPFGGILQARKQRESGVMIERLRESTRGLDR
eukprot:12486041-Alexandrium_andersonii.AAC.1